MSRAPTPISKQRPSRQVLIGIGIIAVLLLLRLFDNVAPADDASQAATEVEAPGAAAPATEADSEADTEADTEAEAETVAQNEAPAQETVGNGLDDSESAEIQSVTVDVAEEEAGAAAAPPSSPPQEEAPLVVARGPPGMPLITSAELPPEALDTIDLIFDDGPFPYRKDGSTFQNREGYLPDEPRGYYSEYTVETPGSSDRGARRIVAGDGGELYYTDDHYNSFSWIVLE